MESIAVRPVSAPEVVAAMHAAGLTAPLECDTPEGIAANGECFEMRTERGACMFVVRRKGDVLWCDGAASTGGTGITEDGLQLLRAIAAQCGAKKIAFETARRGLVRLSKRAGYRVAGVILETDV